MVVTEIGAGAMVAAALGTDQRMADLVNMICLQHCGMQIRIVVSQ